MRYSVGYQRTSTTKFMSVLLVLIVLLAVVGHGASASEQLVVQDSVSEKEGVTSSVPPPPPRIVAVGDLHGDYNHTVLILSQAGVLGKNFEWIGGSHTTLVQVGDLLDRGPSTREILDLFMDLEKKAADAGGKVVTLLGNHEVMNMQGLTHYVHPDDVADFGGAEERAAALSKKGVYGQWLRSRPVMYSDMGTLFVHAGLLPQHARLGLNEVNAQVRRAIEADDWHADILGIRGPLWTRTLVKEAEAEQCGLVEASLRALGLERMVVGHTPRRSHAVEDYCDGRLIVIDTMISRWVEKRGRGSMRALELTRGADGLVEVAEIEVRVPQPSAATSSGDAEPARLEDAMKDPDAMNEMLDLVKEYYAAKNERKEVNDDDAQKLGEF